MPDWNIRLGFSITAVLLLSIAAARAQEPISGPDLLVNDPALDIDGTKQVETSAVVVGSTVCIAWLDEGEVSGRSGFGVSTDSGKTFTDRGPFPPNGAGPDPALAYSQRDDVIYYAAFGAGGIALWRSLDRCQTFEFVGPIATDGAEDKEFIGIDNDPASPFYGRIYAGWTDLDLSTSTNLVSFSDDGGLNWSDPVQLPDGSPAAGQGMWPAIAPNGEVFFAYTLEAGNFLDHWMWRSQDGGVTWKQMEKIAADRRRPSDPNAGCGSRGISGPLTHLPSPQIVAQSSDTAPAGYVIHAVYPYDPDYTGSTIIYEEEFDGPDVSDVFYRRSVDGGQTWSSEHRLNDDATDTDQWYPTVAATDTKHVVVSWYDRRLDPSGNVQFDRYMAISDDRGLSWRPNRRLSDSISPFAFDNCNHGHYDQVAVDKAKAYVVWAADHRGDSDVYFNQVPLIPQGALEASTRLLLLP